MVRSRAQAGWVNATGVDCRCEKNSYKTSVVMAHRDTICLDRSVVIPGAQIVDLSVQAVPGPDVLCFRRVPPCSIRPHPYRRWKQRWVLRLE